MDNQLRRGLLTRKGGFDKLFEECMIRIQRIRQKNDVIQKQIGTDIEQTIRDQVKNQKKFIEKQIIELKDMLNQLQTKYRDPQSKNKIRQLKADAQKQIERNKIILKDLINKSFAQRSMGRAHQHEHDDLDHYVEGGKIDYQSLEREPIAEDENQNRESLLTDRQDMQIDYDLQRKILLEKNEMINSVEQSTLRINEIMNDMAVLVDEQGNNLDIITDDLVKTNENMINTNKNLDEAATLQKRSKKKYKILMIMIIVVIVIVGGVLYFTLAPS